MENEEESETAGSKQQQLLSIAELAAGQSPDGVHTARPSDSPGSEQTVQPMPTVVDDGVIQKPQLPYPVVAIGASAGGLQALKEIQQNLSTDTGMAFVIVTHLAADQRSYLTEITSQANRHACAAA